MSVGSWVAVDLVGGLLVHVFTDAHTGRATYRVGLDVEPTPGIATVLINLTPDERRQWLDALREDPNP